ncbi:MAG: hypothetical protein MJ127_05090 [Mogibacterium sp.]|nr:hypothetical protein [Mogibacterium sp.]
MKEPDKRALRNTGRHGKSIIALATVLVVLIGVAGVYGDSDQWDIDLPYFVDTFDEIEIDDGQIPLSQQKTTTSKKISKKNIKLKKRAKKTYTKVLPKKISTTTSTKKTDTSKIVKKTTIKSEKKDKYTKRKKIKLRTTTTTTTVVTTTYNLTTASTPEGGSPSATDNNPISETSSKATTSAPESNTASISSIAPKASSNVLSAYESMGFKVTIDSAYSYSGCFDARARSITLRKNDDNVYHELGHFVAFVAGNTDVSSAFKAIYNEEKSKYDGRNATYVLRDSSEYFAESYRDYILYNSELKSKRPKTYEAISSAVSRVCDAQVNRLKSAYADIWS